VAVATTRSAPDKTSQLPTIALFNQTSDYSVAATNRRGESDLRTYILQLHNVQFAAVTVDFRCFVSPRETKTVSPIQRVLRLLLRSVKQLAVPRLRSLIIRFTRRVQRLDMFLYHKSVVDDCRRLLRSVAWNRDQERFAKCINP